MPAKNRIFSAFPFIAFLVFAAVTVFTALRVEEAGARQNEIRARIARSESDAIRREKGLPPLAAADSDFAAEEEGSRAAFSASFAALSVGLLGLAAAVAVFWSETRAERRFARRSARAQRKALSRIETLLPGLDRALSESDALRIRAAADEISMRNADAALSAENGIRAFLSRAETGLRSRRERLTIGALAERAFPRVADRVLKSGADFELDVAHELRERETETFPCAVEQIFTDFAHATARERNSSPLRLIRAEARAAKGGVVFRFSDSEGKIETDSEEFSDALARLREIRGRIVSVVRSRAGAAEVRVFLPYRFRRRFFPRAGVGFCLALVSLCVVGAACFLSFREFEAHRVFRGDERSQVEEFSAKKSRCAEAIRAAWADMLARTDAGTPPAWVRRVVIFSRTETAASGGNADTAKVARLASFRDGGTESRFRPMMFARAARSSELPARVEHELFLVRISGKRGETAELIRLDEDLLNFELTRIARRAFPGARILKYRSANPLRVTRDGIFEEYAPWRRREDGVLDLDGYEVVLAQSFCVPASDLPPLLPKLADVWIPVLALGAAFFGVVGVLSSVGRSRGKFAAMLAHELKTPLARVQALVETVASGADADVRAEARRSLGETLFDARRLCGTMFRAFGESAESSPPPERMTAGTLAELASRRAARRLEESGMSLRVRVSPDVRSREISVDADLAEQIVFNLADNAAKYESCRECVFEVGLSRRNLLLRFFPEESSGVARKRPAPGTAPSFGLGLSLSRELARKLGGRLTIRKNGFCPRCFSLSIPAFPRRALFSSAPANPPKEK